EAAVQSDDRMQWWRQTRFGMFIHWGLYSVLGGEWDGVDHGKEMGGASAEWIMLRAPVPTTEYEKLAGQFNPVKFDPTEWVGLAKEAGMKYMVITSKHHDGFSLFDSKMTDYDIMDASPFKRDIIKELADECRKQGIRFGVYYSHSKDWRNRGRSEKARPSKEYTALVKGQLRELLTNYGDMAIIWFDMGDKFTDINTEYGNIVKELQPNCIVSGRLKGKKNIADYRSEADRSIPKRRVTGDVEAPMTLRDNWGYDKDEDNWKTDKDILERISLCVCRGANMLLNMGPQPDGMLCPEEIRSLKAIGGWMKVNGEAIYGTTASPFDFDFPWGSMTQKDNKLYLHVLKWNADGIRFNGLISKPTKAYLLADPEQQALTVRQDAGKHITTAMVPSEAPDPNISIIVLEFDAPVKIDNTAKGKYHWTKGTGIKLQRGKRRTAPN
ncbi:MAG: alpha-L-fucosidase, partial [Planctomycetota bacterium]